MATRSEELRGELTLGTSKFAAGLSDASRQIRSFSSAIPREIGRSFGGTLASVRGFASNVSGILRGAFAISGIGGIVGALGSGLGVVKAINAAADMESLNAEFAVMLGSASKAKAMVADIQKFANATPFETAGLAANAKTLLAFGVAADKILPTLRQLGDVAGSSQDRLDSLALAFAQVTSAGKLQGGDVLQFVNAGFNPLAELARTSGKTMMQLRKDMEGGAITADMVAAAFDSATKAGGRFFGNTAAQSKTWNGMMSSLSDAFKTGLAALGKSLIDYLKPYLKVALDFSSILPVWGKNLGNALVWAFRWFTEAVKGGEIWGIASDRLKLMFLEGSQTFVGGLVGALTLLKNLLVTLFTGDLWKVVGLQMQESALLFVATIQRGLAELMPRVYGAGDIMASANEMKANSVRLDKEKTIKDSFGAGGTMNAIWSGSLDAFKPVEIYKNQISALQKSVDDASQRVSTKAGLGKAPWSDGLAAMFPTKNPTPDTELKIADTTTPHSRGSVGGVNYNDYKTFEDVGKEHQNEASRQWYKKQGLNYDDYHLADSQGGATQTSPTQAVRGSMGGVDYANYKTYGDIAQEQNRSRFADLVEASGRDVGSLRDGLPVPILSRGADALSTANKKADAAKDDAAKQKAKGGDPVQAISETVKSIETRLSNLEVK